MKKFINPIVALFIATAIGTTVFGVATAQTSFAAGTKCGVETSYLDAICSGGGTSGNSGDLQNSGLWQVLIGILNIMLAGVGVLAVAGIVYGAILYSSAGDNQSQVEQAMTLFRNVVIGLVSFALMYSLLQFLIPGGIFAVIAL